jgi:hypothetical protein
VAKKPPGADDNGLPLRWALILAVAAGAGLIVGRTSGASAGVMVAVSVAGFLYLALGKR